MRSVPVPLHPREGRSELLPVGRIIGEAPLHYLRRMAPQLGESPETVRQAVQESIHLPRWDGAGDNGKDNMIGTWNISWANCPPPCHLRRPPGFYETFKPNKYMTHEQIFLKVASTIRNVMAMPERQAILYNDDIEDVFGADSLDKVEIMMKLEQAYEISLDMTDSGIDRMKTVGDLVEEIERQLNINQVKK